MSKNYVTQDPSHVPFSDDEAVRDDELITDGAALASPEEQKARAERRKERAAERERERKELAEKVKAFEERDAKLDRELAELRGELRAVRQQSAPSGSSDPYAQRLDLVYRRQQDAYKAMQAEAKGGALDEDRTAYYEGIAREIEQEKAQIAAERVLARHAPAQEQRAAQQRWRDKYPEIYGNPRAYQFASASYERRKALLEPGQEPTNEMVDEAMEEARAQFRLGVKRSAPSASDRQRLSGMPSSGSGGGPSGAGVTMTPELRKMALALHSDLPEEEAVKRWANTAGRALREKKVL